MFPDPLPMLRTGVVGNFQTLVDPPLGAYFDGHIQLGPEGAVIAVLAGTDDDPGARWLEDPTNSRTVFGITEAGTVLAPVRSFQRSATPGDVSVEVVRWNAGNLLINAPYDEVNDDTVAATKLLYLGLGSWSGRTEHVDEPFNEDGVEGWRIEVRSEQERAVAIDDDLDLAGGRGCQSCRRACRSAPTAVSSDCGAMGCGWGGDGRRGAHADVCDLEGVIWRRSSCGQGEGPGAKLDAA